MDPFRDFDEMRRRMEKMFRGMTEEQYPEFQRPEIDVVNKDKEITVIAEMPGVDKEDIEINAEPTSIEIKASTEKGEEKEEKGYYYHERSSKSYKRNITLPEEVKAEEAKAQYKNGVLEINIPKTHPKKKGTEVEIK